MMRDGVFTCVLAGLLPVGFEFALLITKDQDLS